MIIQLGIERREHRHAGSQHVHRVCLSRHQFQDGEDRLRQRSLVGKLLANLAELLGCRQFAVQQQPDDFFEARVRRQLMHVVAAVQQAGVRVDPADRRLPCDHAFQPGTVRRFVFRAHGRLHSPAIGS